MLVVIRDGEELSLKMNFVLQLFGLSSTSRILRVSRIDTKKFSEKWGNNKIDLATSTSGILAYFLLMMLKSPRDLRDGMIRRLFRKQRTDVLVNEGFFSNLSKALYYYFATIARTDGLIRFLRQSQSTKIFLIDEFLSINTVNLNKLKDLGIIIYVSQDVAHNRYDFKDNLISRELMYKFERKAVAFANVVIACSERDKLKYIEMGAQKAVFYPNIYPVTEFEPAYKDQSPSISIVLRGHWGLNAAKSLEEIFKALSLIHKKIRVYTIGVEPQAVPKNVDLQRLEYIPSKLDYLKILSKSWIGINVGIHMAGTNERKYDYAMANMVVFSDDLGVRGDLLPYEYAYVDSQDLAAKLNQLLEFGKEKIEEMGKQNRKHALSLADNQRAELLTTINNILSCN